MRGHVELLNLDRAIQGKQVLISVAFSKPFREFDRLFPLTTGTFAAIGFAWLQWQVEPRFEPIGEVLADAARRTGTAEVRALAQERYEPGVFDWEVLACAILSGDPELARHTAEQTRYATRGKFGADIFQAVAGILKARLLGDVEAEAAQLALVGRRPDHPMPTPSLPLLRAFVDRNEKALEREIVKGANKHWTVRYLVGRSSMPILVKDEPGHTVIDVTNKDSYTLWAYPEAVFAKVAMQGGITIRHDDLWFPLGLLGGVLGPSQRSEPGRG
jgi:hypothetical protein